MSDLETRIVALESQLLQMLASASTNKRISELDAIPAIADTDLAAIVDATGVTKKGTALQIKNYVGVGQESFDATVGLAGSGADYNDIQDAIDASKYSLLVIGTFTQPTNITTGADPVYIHIAKSLKFTSAIIGIGSGGLRIRGKLLHTAYTSGSNNLFNGSSSLLDIDDVTFLDTSSSATVKLGNMSAGVYIIHNCKFVLPNNAACGFYNSRNGSSFTNLSVSGGGSSCKNFIMNTQDTLIDNIHFEADTFETGGILIQVGSALEEPKISPDVSTVSNVIVDIGTAIGVVSIEEAYTQIANIAGNVDLVSKADSCNFANILGIDFSFSGNRNNNYFANCQFLGSTAISAGGDYNQFANCSYNATFTLEVGSNNNQLLLCKSAGGFTDSGTDNAIIEAISGDETLSADSRRLLCDQKAIKTYADNIAKGITVDYYFSNEPDVAIPDYDIMFPADTGEIESTAAASIIAADTLIQPFVTQTTEPNFTTLLAGIYDIHIHAAKTAGTKDAFIYAKFYKRTYPGGVETLLATSDNSSLLTGSNVGYTIHFSLIDDEVLNATDRLVVKFYGSPSGVGTDPTVTLYLEGTNSSRIDIHTTASSWMLNLQNIIYVNGAGNDSNDGKNMGTPKLTIASALTAAAAQSPSATKIVVVKVLGGQRYAEDVTIPSWVVLDMSDALSYGQVTVGVTMGADSFYYFNEALMPSTKEAIRCAGAGIRYIKGNYTTPEINSKFITASGGATIYLDVVNANAVKTGATFYTLTTGAVLFLKAQTFRETVASTSVGSTVFRNIADDGSNADTTSINETGNQIIKGKDKVVFGTAVAASVLELDGSFQKWTTRPHFIAYNNASIDNVTGDGTVYTIVLGQVDANIGTHYNPATGIFTAPTTGLYNFNIVLVLTDISSLFSDVNIRVLRTGTAATWYLHQSDPDKAYVGGYLILNGSIDMKLNAADTAEFQVQVVGSTKIVDVQQGTTFSGRLLTKT